MQIIKQLTAPIDFHTRKKYYESQLFGYKHSSKYLLQHSKVLKKF